MFYRLVDTELSVQMYLVTILQGNTIFIEFMVKLNILLNRMRLSVYGKGTWHKRYLQLKMLQNICVCNILVNAKGACKYQISTLGGCEGNAYFAYVIRGEWGV